MNHPKHPPTFTTKPLMKCMDVHSLPAAEVRDKTVYNHKERDENKGKKKKSTPPSAVSALAVCAGSLRGAGGWRPGAAGCGLQRPARIATASGASSETRRLQGRSSFKRQ